MWIDIWWPKLRAETRKWLMANNGDAVPIAIVDEIAAVGGPPASEVWWVHEEGLPGPCMPDEAIDWIGQERRPGLGASNHRLAEGPLVRHEDAQ